MKLAVLNPGGRDCDQNFAAFAASPQDAVPHPPVNYHAYAACTGGAFYRDPARIPKDQRCVLLVLRRDLKHCLKTLRQLQAGGRKVAVTLKESGLHQVAQLLADPGNLSIFREICAMADGCMPSTPDLAAIYRGAGASKISFIPTPYPVDSGQWIFGLRIADRAGIFIGTREWDTPSRNHAAALLVAASLGGQVTVVNEEGRSGRKRIEAAGLAEPKIIEGRLPYTEYLRLIARHRVVFQLDRSAVPGQVAGDALLAGVPCVGGDGAVDRIAFPEICGFGKTSAELRDTAARLLKDDAACTAASVQARRLAFDRLSFGAIAHELQTWFSSL